MHTAPGQLGSGGWRGEGRGGGGGARGRGFPARTLTDGGRGRSETGGGGACPSGACPSQPLGRRRQRAGGVSQGAWSGPQAPPPKPCSGCGARWPEKGRRPGAEEVLGLQAGSHDCSGAKVPHTGTQRVSGQRGAGRAGGGRSGLRGKSVPLGQLTNRCWFSIRVCWCNCPVPSRNSKLGIYSSEQPRERDTMSCPFHR